MSLVVLSTTRKTYFRAHDVGSRSSNLRSQLSSTLYRKGSSPDYQESACFPRAEHSTYKEYFCHCYISDKYDYRNDIYEKPTKKRV
ncbi:hypothetical protein GDO78_004970 [Eleutherodactylus coqui]|uniref:Uncharacterized protein n=1 Tax=Eleutherodactylus coqui TaxID=57060 RepID=A0A8J6KDY2_ELECQ|nr:hypothetical protein GDO78_004970 [Eleutherodactylus coqui]